jgi:hypothetical protein
MPERLSVETWYWSMTHARAERLPEAVVEDFGGMPARVSEEWTVRRSLSLEKRQLAFDAVEEREDECLSWVEVPTTT